MSFFVSANAETIRWDGEAGDGQWGNPLNWENDRVPGTADDVILDNTYVADNYIVFLPSGNVQVVLLSLSILPDSFTIECVLPSTNTVSPALQLTRAGDAFIIGAGAVFRNASGASSGTPVTVTSAGSVRINNGGKYIHQTRRAHTDFLVSRLSAAAGTEDGIFEFDVPGTASYTVSASGRTFGKLVFSAETAGAPHTYTGAGINPVLMRGGLEIKANAAFTYGANTNTITIEKNCVIDSGSVFNIANGSNDATVRLKGDLINNGTITETGSSSASAWIFNGTEIQHISCTGSINQEVRLLIDNPQGVILETPLYLDYGLEFLEGKLYSTSTNILSLGQDAFCNGASVSGFVQGPVKKRGRKAFVFPTGAGEIFAPITLGEGGLDDDEFVAEYKRSNPRSVSGLGSGCVFPLQHISYVEYWNLIRTGDGPARQVGLSVSPYSFAYDLESLVVARAENGVWISEGGTDHIPITAPAPYVAGSFISSAGVEAFGAFTIGSLSNQQQNPLPLLLEYFDARLVDNKTIVHWKTGVCPPMGIRSKLIHKDQNGRATTLWTSHGKDTSCHYQYIHTLPGKGNNIYELALFDEQDRLLYSANKTVRIEKGEEYWLRNIRATGDYIEFQAKLPLGNTKLLIIDMSGKVIYSAMRNMRAEEESVSIQIAGISRGVYLLVAFNGQNRVSQTFIP